MKCETCGAEGQLLTYSLPGIPASVSNCVRCWSEDLYPVWAIVGETASIGGLEHAAAWWKDVVARSLPVVGLTEEEFDKQVNHVILEFLESKF